MGFIKAQRIKSLMHIQRMDKAGPARKLIDWKPMGTRTVGRPRQRWKEDVMEDLKKLKVKNWKGTARDRRTWRDLAEKAKTHKGLQCQMMMMNMMMMMMMMVVMMMMMMMMMMMIARRGFRIDICV